MPMAMRGTHTAASVDQRTEARRHGMVWAVGGFCACLSSRAEEPHHDTRPAQRPAQQPRRAKKPSAAREARVESHRTAREAAAPKTDHRKELRRGLGACRNHRHAGRRRRTHANTHHHARAANRGAAMRCCGGAAALCCLVRRVAHWLGKRQHPEKKIVLRESRCQERIDRIA